MMNFLEFGAAPAPPGFGLVALFGGRLLWLSLSVPWAPAPAVHACLEVGRSPFPSPCIGSYRASTVHDFICYPQAFWRCSLGIFKKLAPLCYRLSR